MVVSLGMALSPGSQDPLVLTAPSAHGRRVSGMVALI